MRRKIIIGGLVFLLLVCARAHAEEFSADMYTNIAGQPMEGTISVSGGKARMELAGMVTITRVDQAVVWVLMPEARTYMEMPLDSQHLAAFGADNPEELNSEFLGSEVIDGRNTEKHRIIFDLQGKQTAIISWTLPDSGIPLKTQAEDGSWSMEYRNIREESPAPSLFEIPEGYQRMVMSMPALPGAGQPGQGAGTAAMPDIQGLLRQMGQGVYDEED